MYEAQFGLHDRPFPATPHADRFFPSGTAERARQAAFRSLDRGAGPVLVIGPPGTGKTMLCRRLAADFGDPESTIHLNTMRLCSRRVLLQALLYELKRPYQGLDEGELRISLIDHMSQSDACADGILLFVDEAHLLPPILFEEIRLITNLERDGEPIVRLLLAGAPKLDELLSNPQLASFNQRVSARSILEPLGRDESIRFIEHQLLRCGGVPNRIFSSAALDAVFTATHGIPRLINQLCDHALIMACIGRHPLVKPQHIQEAWSDLQQLPLAVPLQQFGGWEKDHVVEFVGTESASHPLTDNRHDPATLPPVGPSEDSRDPRTEVELIFHGPHPLFGESFDEEEVLIDPYSRARDSRSQLNEPSTVSAPGGSGTGHGFPDPPIGSHTNPLDLPIEEVYREIGWPDHLATRREPNEGESVFELSMPEIPAPPGHVDHSGHAEHSPVPWDETTSEAAVEEGDDNWSKLDDWEEQIQQAWETVTDEDLDGNSLATVAPADPHPEDADRESPAIDAEGVIPFRRIPRGSDPSKHLSNPRDRRKESSDPAATRSCRNLFSRLKAEHGAGESSPSP